MYLIVNTFKTQKIDFDQLIYTCGGIISIWFKMTLKEFADLFLHLMNLVKMLKSLLYIHLLNGFKYLVSIAFSNV
jgi:hypothetical protein